MGTVADEEFLRRHDELFHYTTIEGLEGIYRSNSLRVTKFTDLNDSSEYTYLRMPLIAAVADRFRQTLQTARLSSSRIDRLIRDNGGLRKIAAVEATRLIDIIYREALEPETASSGTTPYTMSFCSHGDDQPYEREHGLLSQWRGYGQRGGICIILDTRRLAALLEEEDSGSSWAIIRLSNVAYGPGRPCGALFDTLVETCDLALRQVMGTAPLIPPERSLNSFHLLAPFFKHEGFKEEKEVRIVAIPYTLGFTNVVRKRAPWLAPPQIKVVRTEKREDWEKRHVTLFEDMPICLPIKRVIVGPGRHQADSYDRARSLLDDEIGLSRSATPFLG